MNLNMKKPCANCPFRKQGAIRLRPGRLDGIVAGLADNRDENFVCHKTTDGPQAGTYECDDEGEEVYIPSGNESACMGAIIYMLKLYQPSLGVMLALRAGMLDLGEIQAQNDEIIDPIGGFAPQLAGRQRSKME